MTAEDLVLDLRAWVDKLTDDIGPPVKEKDWRVAWEVFRAWEARVAHYLLQEGATDVHDALAKASGTIVAGDEKGNLRRALRAKTSVIDEYADSIDKDPARWQMSRDSGNVAKPVPRAEPDGGVVPEHERPNILVHGSETAMRDTVGQYLEELGCKPLIEADPAEDDRTGIDRFVARALTAQFGVILLTTTKGANAPSQDGILRLGYLAGLLGKRRVLALTSGKLSLPANLLGITVISFELADWKSRIAEALTSSIRTRV